MASAFLKKRLDEAELPLPEPSGHAAASHFVDVEELMQFIFPKGFFHSASTARLYIFADYGPVLINGRLRSGYKGQHLVTDQELADMIEIMVREDILRIYVGNQVLPQKEQDDVIRQADSKFKNIPNYSRTQMEELLSRVRKNDEGKLDFHHLQEVVRQNREAEIRERKKMYPDVVIKSHKSDTSVFSKLQKPRAARKLRDSEIFMQSAKQLSAHSSSITNIGEGTSPGIVQNVKILKEDREPSKIDPLFPRWSNIPAGCGRGDFVKKHTPFQSMYSSASTPGDPPAE